MRKLFLLLLFLPTLIFAQVPQGVGYQGVATDAAGFELINQSISIRASVISGSATGIIEWQETHNTSTDTFGLFNLTIGQGISTGTGAQTSFADITWGANTHFLKIEMDVNGGTNYSHMGTNQMMSVPYALYAENANIDYDSIATILSNDSSFINNLSFGGNMVFGDFIDLNNILNVHTISSHYFTSDTIRLNEDGFLFFNTNSSSLSPTGSVWAQISSDSLFNSPMLIFGSGNFNEGVVIPVKKDSYLHLIGNQAYWTYPKWLPIINGSGSSSSGSGSNIGNGSGCDVIYPEGYSGEILTYKFSSEYIVPSGKNLTMTWLVKNSTSGGSEILYVNGKKIIPYIGPGGILPYSNQEGDMSLRNPFIFSEGDTLSTWITNQSSSSDMIMNGFLTDKNVESVIHSFCEDNVNYSGGSWQGLFNYTVPNGKKLFIQGFYAKNPSNCDLEVDGNAFLDLDNGLELPSIPMQFSSGQVLSLSNPTGIIPEDIHFIGYLADENYFADCGGGGGTSTSTIDSSYIDSLVQFYSSGNMLFGSYENLDLILNHNFGNYSDTISFSEDGFLTGIFGGSSNIESRIYIIDSLGNDLMLSKQYHPHNDINSFSVPIPKNTNIVAYRSGGGFTNYNWLPIINGSGSSSSIVDSSYIDSLVQYYVSNNTIGGCNIDPFYPDGMEGVDYTNIYITNSTPYTVPANKTFYLYTNYSSGLYINGQLGNVIGGDHFFPIPVGEGIEMNLNGGSIAGYLIDKKFDVINYLGGGTNYTVPNDMYLYVLHAPTYISINSSNSAGPTTLQNNNVARTPLVFQPGDIISSPFGISGLLIPIDYCNQTGSTSINSFNSGGSCDIEFPDGLSSTIVSESISSSNTYSVPSGKSLYITQASVSSSSGQNSLKIDGVEILGVYGSGNTSWTNNSGVIIAPSGSIISSGSSNLGQCQFNGLLVNEGSEVIVEEISSSNTYSVPSGKSLYITQASVSSSSGQNSLKIDGVEILGVYGSGNTSWTNNSGVIIAPSGSIISSGTSNLGQCQINGYLVDSNYFSNCNGGGSSGGNSSSTPNKLIYTIDGF